MRKMIITMTLCLVSLICACPPASKVRADKAKVKLHEAKWERMVEAITFVESRNDDHAYNEVSGALGRFQMKKIYVDDANRISELKGLGKKFAYHDRTNRVKAREMFDIVQGHYNPERSINKAIRLHRGKKSPKYEREINKHMRK